MDEGRKGKKNANIARTNSKGKKPTPYPPRIRIKVYAAPLPGLAQPMFKAFFPTASFDPVTRKLLLKK